MKSLKQELQDTFSDELIEKTGINIYSDRFDPKMDFVFKAIFTQNTKESEIARIDFLSSILAIPITNATVIQNELAIKSSEEKQSTLDIHIKLDTGEEINVEIQVRNDDNMINRSEFYCSKLFGSQDAKSKQYRDLSKVIEIMIVNFTLFHNREEFADEYMYRNANGDILSGNTKIIFLELVKLTKLLKKPVEEMTPQEMWAVFLKFGNDEKRKEIITKIETKREGIAMAGEILSTISKDRTMQLAYMDRLKFETDQVSKLGFAENRGINIGMNIGMNRGMQLKALEIAKKMLLRGIDIAHVSEDTGLPVDEVNKLKNMES